MAKHSTSSVVPQPHSLGCLSTLAGRSFDWHTHPYDEICLVDASHTTIGHAGVQHSADVGTLFLFRHGERHGYWNARREAPRFWIVHYQPDEHLYQQLSALDSTDPLKRIWHLSPEQIETYKGLLLKIVLERSSNRPGSLHAQSAWLRLLLISLARWQSGKDQIAPDPQLPDAELQQVWQIINKFRGDSGELIDALKREIPNYDSVRHRFRKVMGQSPAKFWAKMRLEQAKHLLVESSQSIKEIASRLGYPRQHEFTRAFTKTFGVSPTSWRNGGFHQR